MKSVVLCFVLAAVATGCASTGAFKGFGSASVEAASGKAEIAQAAGNWKTARVGQALAPGGKARTGPNSTIDFSLGKNGGVLRLQPDSELEFEKIGMNSATDDSVAILNLTEGRVTGDTLKLPNGTRVIVKTPAGMHEIR